MDMYYPSEDGQGYTKAMPEETQKALDTLFQRPVLSNGILGGTAFAVAASEDYQSDFVAVDGETMEFKQEDWDKLNDINNP